MKAHELRIGNLLNYQTADKDFFLVTRIDWQDLKSISKDEKAGNISYSPIPLTEEWLLKFGFELRDGFSNTFKLNVEKHQFDCSEITYSEKEGLLRFSNGQVKGVTIIPHIKYVHQLQNLYFALTGEELTIKPE